MRGRRSIVTLLAALGLAAAGVAGAQAVDGGAPAGSAASAAAPAAAAAPAPSVAAGRRAYTSYCVRCHGINLVVGSSAFYDLRSFPATDKARFLHSVNKGVRAMPAWEGIVKPDELESIWLYIGSVNGWPPDA
ncbi:MAG: cytochrome c [Rubrivivax sp.]|nr:cytochrome c [Rubrivivax sp.]